MTFDAALMTKVALRACSSAHVREERMKGGREAYDGEWSAICNKERVRLEIQGDYAMVSAVMERIK
jgi:hypothetical protein